MTINEKDTPSQEVCKHKDCDVQLTSLFNDDVINLECHDHSLQRRAETGELQMETSINQKVKKLQELKEEQNETSLAIYALEKEIMEAMLSENRLEVPDPNFSILLKKNTQQYDKSLLFDLFEFLDEETIKEKKAYIPEKIKLELIDEKQREHAIKTLYESGINVIETKTPAKWDGSGLNRLHKLGGNVSETIDECKLEATYRLEVKKVIK